jgi:ArsR family transcriptional regulator
MSIIMAAEAGEICVCDLTSRLALSQPTVSHHLKVLLDAGLVSRDKRGVWAYYRAVPGALGALADLLAPIEAAA